MQLSASVGWNLSPGTAGPLGLWLSCKGLRGPPHLPAVPKGSGWAPSTPSLTWSCGRRKQGHSWALEEIRPLLVQALIRTCAFSVRGHFAVFGLVSSCWHAFLRDNLVSDCSLYNIESCPP